jgi:hypothetical protein
MHNDLTSDELRQISDLLLEYSLLADSYALQLQSDPSPETRKMASILQRDAERCKRLIFRVVSVLAAKYTV